MNLYIALSWCISKVLRYFPYMYVTRGLNYFTCYPHKNHTCLLPSRKASPPFGWYSLRSPTKGWPGWVELGDWLHTEINVPHRELNQPDTVTHPSTDRARRRLTSLI